MKTYALILTTILCFTANADVLTFDDITTGTVAYVPEGYGGFSWNMTGAVVKNYYPGSGYENGIVSGEYVGFNVLGGKAVVSGPLFDFNGVYLTAAWREGLNVTITGYLGDAALYEKTVTVDLYEPTWADLNYAGIDKLTFESSGGTDVLAKPKIGPHFVMDNFTFNETPPVILVTLDIMPGACPNKVNVNGKGLLSVAIAGSAELSVYDIDAMSFEILGKKPVKIGFEDVTSPGEEIKSCDCVTGDADGKMDLVLKFDREALLQEIGDVQDGDSVILTLTGSLRDDTLIEGSDCIQIMDKGNGQSNSTANQKGNSRR